MRKALVVLLAVAAPAVLAQESASYTLKEHVFNAGGRPDQGTVASSASYTITLDAIAEGVVAGGLSSSSYRLDASFAGAYPPPAEVLGLKFVSADDLVWKAGRSARHYNLYRDEVGALPGEFGACHTAGIESCEAVDAAQPTGGHAWFYLVTAENRLFEEGTKGWQSDGTPRPNPTACP